MLFRSATAVREQVQRKKRLQEKVAWAHVVEAEEVRGVDSWSVADGDADFVVSAETGGGTQCLAGFSQGVEVVLISQELQMYDAETSKDAEIDDDLRQATVGPSSIPVTASLSEASVAGRARSSVSRRRISTGYRRCGGARQQGGRDRSGSCRIQGAHRPTSSQERERPSAAHASDPLTSFFSARRN